MCSSAGQMGVCCRLQRGFRTLFSHIGLCWRVNTNLTLICFGKGESQRRSASLIKEFSLTDSTGCVDSLEISSVDSFIQSHFVNLCAFLKGHTAVKWPLQESFYGDYTESPHKDAFDI